MMGSLYEALKEGGTSDQRAKAAAEEVAGYEHHFTDLRSEIADLKSTQRLHSWILTFNTAMLVALVLRTFWP